MLPEWSGKPSIKLYLEVIKGGVQLENFLLKNKEIIVVGRLPNCDLQLEHQSISRYHALFQFNEKGECYIYDLGSTHGTFVNKVKIEQKKYALLKEEDQIKFGESTRIFIFKTEINTKVRAYQDQQKETEVTWGFAEDAVEEEDINDLINDDTNEQDAYYYKDPKKALKNYLENQGVAVEYEISEEGEKNEKEYTAKVLLPIPELESLNSDIMYGIGHSNKKREAERLAALNACEKLDKMKLLRSNGLSISDLKKQRLKRLLKENEAEEFDDFYDRTGYVEKSKLRKNQRKEKEDKIETFDSLNFKRKQLIENINNLKMNIIIIQNKIDEDMEIVNECKQNDNELDGYMTQMKISENRKLKKENDKKLNLLTIELKKVLKLIEIVAPDSKFDEEVDDDDTLKQKIRQNNSNIIDKEKEVKIKENKEADKNKIEEKEVRSEEIKEISSEGKVINNEKEAPNNDDNNNEGIKKIESKVETNNEKDDDDDDDEGYNFNIQDDNNNWVPPQGQSGDGRSHLNDKYGY
ncbi:hypothetical protein K502DRAFT_343588 [Neoconidiobolus thromboides FSU 785]|nr:hypothetical protein K502DRAFT_343588 [Neoconidiobolus thromboides FSU 785]